ncbi:MAG: TrmH family RNA methyltransferase [Myxococcota bacterium]|nr:TrmH family RNA methyltransferase [Myxococcota bacterium]
MPLRSIRVVLVRPLQPGNIGAVARSIANHGLGGLTLVAPPAFDPDRARWMAPGARHIIDQALIVGTVREGIGNARRVVGTSSRKRRWEWPMVGLSTTCDEILTKPIPTALLFGPEDMGLSNDDLGLCHSILTLPTAEHASLNLAQAVTAVGSRLLDEAQARGLVAPAPPRQGRRGGPIRQTVRPLDEPSSPDPPAPSFLVDSIVEDALEILQHSDYFKNHTPAQVRGTLFRMLSRSEPTQPEAAVIRGMLKTVRWALKDPP